MILRWLRRLGPPRPRVLLPAAAVSLATFGVLGGLGLRWLISDSLARRQGQTPRVSSLLAWRRGDVAPVLLGVAALPVTWAGLLAFIPFAEYTSAACMDDPCVGILEGWTHFLYMPWLLRTNELALFFLLAWHGLGTVLLHLAGQRRLVAAATLSASVPPLSWSAVAVQLVVAPSIGLPAFWLGRTLVMLELDRGPIFDLGIAALLVTCLAPAIGALAAAPSLGRAAARPGREAPTRVGGALAAVVRLGIPALALLWGAAALYAASPVPRTHEGSWQYVDDDVDWTASHSIAGRLGALPPDHPMRTACADGYFGWIGVGARAMAFCDDTERFGWNSGHVVIFSLAERPREDSGTPTVPRVVGHRDSPGSLRSEATYDELGYAGVAGDRLLVIGPDLRERAVRLVPPPADGMWSLGSDDRGGLVAAWMGADRDLRVAHFGPDLREVMPRRTLRPPRDTYSYVQLWRGAGLTRIDLGKPNAVRIETAYFLDEDLAPWAPRRLELRLENPNLRWVLLLVLPLLALLGALVWVGQERRLAWALRRPGAFAAGHVRSDEAGDVHLITPDGETFAFGASEARRFGFDAGQTIEGTGVVASGTGARLVRGPGVAAYRQEPVRIRRPLVARGDLEQVRALAGSLEVRAKLVALTAIALASVTPIATLLLGSWPWR